MKKLKFEVGKWYNCTKHGYFGKYLRSEEEHEFISSERRLTDYQKGKYCFNDGYIWKEALIKEIQEFLPKGHPDLSITFKTGDYIVIIQNNKSGWNGTVNYCYKLIDSDQKDNHYYKKNFRIALENSGIKARHAIPKEIERWNREGKEYDINTIEEQKLFKLPEKWCIKVNRDNDPQEVSNWRKSTWVDSGYINNTKNHNCRIHSGYTEITLDQFKKYVLGSDYDIDKEELLTESDLIDGEIYKQIYDYKVTYIFKAYKNIAIDIKGHFYNGDWSTNGYQGTLLTTTQKEKDWLNACIVASTFIPKDQVINKRVVQCTTQEQWDFITEKLSYKWNQNGFWDTYKENTCISLNPKNEFSPVSFYKEENYQIISFQEWLDENGYVFEEEAKPKPVDKWSVGSYVTVIIDSHARSKSNQILKIKDVFKITHSFNDLTIGIEGYSHCCNKSDFQWFATKTEAEEFAKTLTKTNNANEMKTKYKIGDKVEITSTTSNYSGLRIGDSFVVGEVSIQNGGKDFWYRKKIGDSRGVIENSVKLKTSKESIEVGTYIRYKGTKQGTASKDWDYYFGKCGVKSGDVGKIKSIHSNNSKYFINDKIRSGSSGFLIKEDFDVISEKEYLAGRKDKSTNLIKENLIEGKFYHFWYEDKTIGSLVKWKHYSMDLRCNSAPKKWASNTLSNSAYCEIIKEATLDEIKWLEVCEKANKFISKEEALKVKSFSGKYNIGDIIVSLSDVQTYRKKGDIFKVLPESHDGLLYYKQNRHGTRDWRIATSEEAVYFKAGGINIKNMDKVEQSKLDLVRGGIYANSNFYGGSGNIIIRYTLSEIVNGRINVITRLFNDGSGGCDDEFRDLGSISDFKTATLEQMQKLINFENSRGFIWDGAKLVKIDNPYELGGTAQPVVEPNPFEEVPIQLRTIKSIINKVN